MSTRREKKREMQVFIERVKNALNPEKLTEFFRIMKKIHTEGKSDASILSGLIMELKELFREHPDLLFQLNSWLPRTFRSSTPPPSGGVKRRRRRRRKSKRFSSRTRRRRTRRRRKSRR